MFRFGRSPLEEIVGWSAFVLVLALWSMFAFYWWSRRTKRQHQLHQRLGIEAPDDGDARTLHLWRQGQTGTVVVPGTSLRRNLVQRLEELRRKAGWRASLGTVFMGLLACMLIAFVAGLLWTGQVLVALLAPVAVLLVFWVWVRRSILMHAATFDRQLLDALELAVRSLRANHPLLGAFRLVSEEVPDPVGRLFGQVCQQQALGMSLEDSLQKVAVTSDHPEFKLFATSISIQLRSGGHLADMMERLAQVIRDRLRLGRRVRVLTAQVQLSKRILLVLPFIMCIVLSVISPDHVRTLYMTKLGQLLLLCGAASLLLGAMVMNSMAKVRY